ncbi:DNA ligase D [Polyangium spumosum]|uniref:DNA ligase (ATP) n=1 Tax=Polyangium spumosum TaxID=889282 RepID=A0A6N7PVS1_9BACT|nr:DNA ligase D [Polyangium spumosum]MRG94174.1 DNA ligase D [Polyangium spumosum]
MPEDPVDGSAKLDAYRKKRDPGQTPEPFAAPAGSPGETTEGAYVVHLHDARRRHYDLRLEVGGALESFSVPKGPTLHPGERRLAVRTEPHPIEYLHFEDVIPEGNYGAGPMIAWDTGSVRYLGEPAEEQLRKGKLEFELSGHKLHGRFLLVRLKDSEKDWLLFKKHDAFADPGRDIVQEKPRSVLSGLDVAELGHAKDIEGELLSRAEALGAPTGSIETNMVPMRACPAPKGSLGSDYVFELKLDGVRCIARKNGSDVLLQSRTLRDVSRVYPEVARAVHKLPAARLVLDGELIALDQAGQPSFQRLAQRIHLARGADIRRAEVRLPVLYVVFDLLAIGDRDLRRLPLHARKELLHHLVRAPGEIRSLDMIEGDPTMLLDFCRERRMEGLVAKRRDAPYRPGPARSYDWIKLKCERDDDFVVVGYTLGEGARARLGALDVAAFEAGELRYRGKVGSGLDADSIEALLARLDPSRTDKPTAGGAYNAAPRGRVHVRPELVVSVRFSGYTDEGNLRFPVFRGIRDDVAPEECVASPHADREESEIERLAAESAHAGAAAAGPSKIPVSNPDKVLFPADGITKRDIADYYAAVAPVLLPHLRDRPVMLVRYPDGITGKFFYQWNVPAGLPDWVPTLRVRLPGREEEMEVFHIRDEATLLLVASLGAIPIHVIASRVPHLEQADFLNIDLDISGGTFSHVLTLARSLKDLLDRIGLTGFPKTSGQSGLHVFVPLGPDISYETARALADLLGHMLVREHPDIATMERSKARRGPRVYVDTGQTGASRTIVAPYAVRAVQGARVSTPLGWDEVDASLDPRAFDIRTVPRRVARTFDPMAALLTETPAVLAAIERLGKLALGRHVA